LWLPPRDHTADDLLRRARLGGFDPKKRLITDWVSIGLLDQPTARGRGRGKGVERTWPESQAQLFLVLLAKRREITHVASLCNVPAFTWLYYGPEQVPVRQVRRALCFFNRLLPTAPASVARKAARRVVEQLSTPTTTRADQEELITAVVQATGGREFNRDALLEPARRIFDPDRTGRRVGPRGAAMTAESWVNVTEATLVGAQTIPHLAEEQFETARLAHHQTMAGYLQQHQEFARDPDIGQIFDTPTLDWLANNACSQITTTIGFLELARQRGAHQDQPGTKQP
jgi:hypothetical protein